MLIPCHYYHDRDRIKIRERCEQLGKPVKWVALMLDVTEAAICYYNTGGCLPRLPLLKKISMLLDCKMDDLLHLGKSIKTRPNTPSNTHHNTLY